jgi:glycosyltransferase involved in cell wall biosynthesis
VLITRYRIDPAIVRIVPGGIDAVKNDPGITRREARDALGWPQDRPIVLSIRRLVKRVGVDVLVDAAKMIVARHPELLILIGGTGPLSKELQSKIDAYDLRNQVRLLGYIPDDLLSTAYRAADLSVVPTQELEGFGLVTLESMAAGTPPVVTPVGALPEVVAPLSKDLVLADRTAQAIAEGISEILKNSELPSDKACRDYVQTRFDWEAIALNISNVYRELS